MNDFRNLPATLSEDFATNSESQNDHNTEKTNEFDIIIMLTNQKSVLSSKMLIGEVFSFPQN
jgi:hypothetical protein